MKRKRPNLREQLAAACIQLNPDIREWAKLKSAADIIAIFDADHFPVPVALGGTNHPTNLEMRLRHEHRTKTAKKDIPAIAKAKRLTRKQEEFRARMLAKDYPHFEVGFGQTPSGARKWVSRPMDGTVASGRRKRWNGTVERRPPAK